MKCVRCGGEISPPPYTQCEVPGRVHFDYADCIEWKQGPPTEPGWYWNVDPRYVGDPTSVFSQVLEVVELDGRLVVELQQGGISEIDPCEWFMRIEQPQPPEVKP